MSDAETATSWTADALGSRIVRYADLKPCYNAFIDTRTPGSEAKENFTIIGPGVSENPEQYVHIAEPHGFNIGGARQPPGCVNSQHSHETAETFVAHTGTWRFDLGERGEDAQVVLRPGDTISIPTRTFRGFTNIGDDPGFLWAVLGQDNPGRVTWAPQVFEMAKDYGLILLENGRLVDSTKGEAIPEDKRPMPVTSPEQVAALTRYSQEEAEKLVVRAENAPTRIIGEGAPLGWDHGFTVDRYELDGASNLDPTDAVLFVHRGSLALQLGDVRIELGEGDTMSIPGDVGRFQVGGAAATLFVVRRS